MKRFNFYVLTIILAVVATALASCVNEEYSMDDLNKEITVGGDSLTLPIGSTKQLFIKGMLPADLDKGILQTLEGGAYALRIKNKLSLGDQMPDLSNMVDVSDIEVKHEVVYNLSDVSTESMSTEEQSFESSFEIASEDLHTDVNLPEIFEESIVETGIWKYAKDAQDMVIEIDEEDMKTTVEGVFHIPDGLDIPSGIVMPIGDQHKDIEPEIMSVTTELDRPEGVYNIHDIKMSAESKVKVTLSVENVFVTEGRIVPNMSLNLLNLMTVEDKGQVTNKIAIGEEFVLDHRNGFVSSHEYPISEIFMVKGKTDPQNPNPLFPEINGVIEETAVLNRNVGLTGYIDLYDGKTTSDLINSMSGKAINLNVVMEFPNGLKIKSVIMDVEEIEVTETMEVPITIDEMELPDGVKSIDMVTFTENSSLEMLIKFAYKDRSNIDPKSGLIADLKDFKMKFPEEITVKEADENGEFILDNTSVVGDGVDEWLHISKIDFKNPVEGKLFYEGVVTVDARMVLRGECVNSENIPHEEEKDLEFIVDAIGHFEKKDYLATVEGLTHTLEIEPKDCSYELPDGVSDFGVFSIIPKGENSISIDLNIPESSLKTMAAEDGIVLSFPEYIIFKNIPSEYNFNGADNSITLKGELPEQILLPIEKLLVKPVKNQETGKYIAEGQLMISGAVELAPGQIWGTQVDDMIGKEAQILAVVPAIEADEVSFEHFEITADQTFDFTILDGTSLPEYVKNVSEVTLDEVYAVIDLNVDNFPDMGPGKYPNVEFTLTMPDELVLDSNDSRVDPETNIVTLEGIIKNNKLDVDPIKILALDLSEYDFNSGESLVDSIAFNGRVYVDNPEVDVDELEGDMLFNINANIADIKVKKVVANVDYKIDSIKQNIPLTDLPDFMKGDGFVLDLANPHLAITVKTNMNVPVSGKINIIPMVNGEESELGRVVADITLPCSPDPAVIDSTVFWFGEDKEACPADYVFIPAEINKLIRYIPDELKIDLQANVDPTKECAVEPSAKYILDADYDITVPLAFGPDFHIEICDTINRITPIVGQVLEKNNLQLGGNVTSALPIQLLLGIELLDEDRNVIPSEPAQQKIRACNSDGSPSVSPLDLKLDILDGNDAKNVSALKLTFAITSPNMTTMPLSDDDFVQVDLKIAVPGGITVDLGELNNEEN